MSEKGLKPFSSDRFKLKSNDFAISTFFVTMPAWEACARLSIFLKMPNFRYSQLKKTKETAWRVRY